MSEKRTVYISVEIETDLPGDISRSEIRHVRQSEATASFEAVKEHLAMYCEAMGDVKMTNITTSKERCDKWHSTK